MTHRHTFDMSLWLEGSGSRFSCVLGRFEKVQQDALGRGLAAQMHTTMKVGSLFSLWRVTLGRVCIRSWLCKATGRQVFQGWPPR